MLCVQKSVLFLAVVGVAGSLASCRSRTFSEAKDNSPNAAATAPVTATTFDVDALSGEELYKLTQENVFSEKIHRIYIKMNKASYESMKQDEHAHGCEGKFDVKWAHVRHFVFDDIDISNTAVKIRGNTSRCIPRVQLSVKFNKTKGVSKKNYNWENWTTLAYPADVENTIEKQSLFGLEGLSLRRSGNDSSSSDEERKGFLGREFVSTWGFAQTEALAKTTVRGAPVYRATYAWVEFQLCANDADEDCNDRRRQIYNVAENINEQFIKERYDVEKPTLIQHDHGCGFKQDKSFDVECYGPAYVEGKKYDESNPKHNDKLTKLLDGPDGLRLKLEAAKTEADVAALLDIDSFLNYMVAAGTLGHWDSAYGNFNNDFMFYDSGTGRWKIIAWDLDNTLVEKGRGSVERNYSYSDVAPGPRTLFDPFFRIPSLQARVQQRFKDYLALMYKDRNGGPLNDRIIHARDNFVSRLVSTCENWDKDRLNRDACLHDANKVDTDLAQGMFNYIKERYLNLKDQLK